jgi:hypothetical protein
MRGLHRTLELVATLSMCVAALALLTLVFQFLFGVFGRLALGVTGELSLFRLACDIALLVALMVAGHWERRGGLQFLSSGTGSGDTPAKLVQFCLPILLLALAGYLLVHSGVALHGNWAAVRHAAEAGDLRSQLAGTLDALGAFLALPGSVSGIGVAAASVMIVVGAGAGLTAIILERKSNRES